MLIKETTIFYINRQCDVARRIQFEKRMKQLGIKNYQKIEAIDGRRLKIENYRYLVASILNQDPKKLIPEYWASRKNFSSLTMDINKILPRVGCLLSHLKALKLAVDYKLENVLILEDDAYLLDTCLDDFEIPYDADIVYLGGTFKKVGEDRSIKSGPVKISPDFLKLFGTFAYYIPNPEKINEIYRFLNSIFLYGIGRKKVNNWRSGNVRMLAGAVDRMYINHYQKNGNTYFINPPVVTHQDYGISTLNNNVSKYKLKFEY